MKPEEMSKFVKETTIELVDLEFNDLPTLWHHFSS